MASSFFVLKREILDKWFVKVKHVPIREIMFVTMIEKVYMVIVWYMLSNRLSQPTIQVGFRVFRELRI